MTALTSAHRGYEYQDLMVAVRLVDVLLESIVEIRVDEKLVPDDRFDDLTTVDQTGHRERTQFKYTDNADQALTLATFTNDARSLRLDRIVSAALEDRNGPGKQYGELSFRIMLSNVLPTDRRLLSVLRQANPDPGPFVPEINSVRMSFRADALWGEFGDLSAKSRIDSNPFSFLQTGDGAVERPDLDWVCERLIVELAAPAASLDLTNPGAAEQLLLNRVRNKLGTGTQIQIAPTSMLQRRSSVAPARHGKDPSLSLHQNCSVGLSFVATSALSAAPIQLMAPSKYRAHRLSPNWLNRHLQQPTKGKLSCSLVRRGKGNPGFASNWSKLFQTRTGSSQNTTAISVMPMENGFLASSQSQYSEASWDE